ncbi:hypothetical protein A3F06_00295 [candidate division TM6 bacterium RIFCSPHIGHO2_12_FULL_36_22]|nr:MAG: hypothetical protein A3F06_00295 [candidate division TM6 bacterium RIFCSPHIGHO2_12_FULL_36_22]
MKKFLKNLLYIALIAIGSVCAETQQNVSIEQEAEEKENNVYFKEAAQVIKSERSPINLHDPVFLPMDNFINAMINTIVVKGVKQMMVAYACTNFNFSSVTQDNAPELYAFVKKVCIKLGIDIPKIYITHDLKFVNCVAGGKMILLGPSFLYNSSKDSAEFTIAHELGHVAQKVELKKITASVLTSIPVYMAYGYFLKTEGIKNLLIPTRAIKKKSLIIATVIVQKLLAQAYSRSLEYDADKKAFNVTGNYKGLQELCTFMQKLEDAWLAEGQPLNVRIHGYINKIKWLRTHPTPADRLQVLSA